MTEGNNQIYLVTGASGFVGEHLVRFLRRQGILVRAMVHDPRKADSLRDTGAEIIAGELRDQASLRRAVEGVAGVYHIAAVFRQAALPDRAYFEINAEGVRHMLDAAITAGVKRFVHCSTIGVLGSVKNPPGDEQTPYSPGDIYQESKMEGEKIALRYFKEGKIRGVVIRPAMIYGHGDRRTFKLFKMVAEGRFFYVGRGDSPVHFVDVRDLVRGFWQAMQHEERSGDIYILAGERSVPLKVFVNMAAQYLKVKEPWLHLPVGPVHVAADICEAVCRPLRIEPPLFRRRVDFFTKCRHFNTAKAQRDLGFKAARPLEEELADILKWYLDHGWIKAPRGEAANA